MATNPYEYDRYNQSITGKPQQQHNYENRSFPANLNQQQPYVPTYQWLPQARAAQRPNQQQGYAPVQQRVPQAAVDQKAKVQKAKPMPKARALALVNTLKKSLVVAALAMFVSFSGLAAFHQVSTTASKTTSVSSTSSSSSSQSSGKNILNQTGGSNIGTSSASQGTSSGTSSTGSSSSSSSSAVSGSSVS